MAYRLHWAYLAWVILHDQRTRGEVSQPMLALRALGTVLLLVGGCGLLVFSVMGKTGLLNQPGGVLGRIIANFLYQTLNADGALLLLLATLLTGITWLTGLSWVRLTEIIGRYVLKFLSLGMRASVIVMLKIKALLKQLMGMIQKRRMAAKAERALAPNIKPSILINKGALKN